MKSKISVIIPVYNAENYLYECINSIITQSYKNLEIICINDGSTDNSINILKRFQNYDSRIIIKSIVNGGVSNARNVGIKLATGEYIAFIDSDDYIQDNYFSELLKYITSYECDLSVCSIQNVGFKSNIIQMENSIFEFNNPDFDLWYNMNIKFLLYGPCNKLYKASIIKNNSIYFYKELVYGEDLVFNFDYLKYIDKICYTNTSKYYYRHDSSQSLSKKYRKNRYYNELVLHKKMVSVMQSRKLYNSDMEEYLYHRLFDSAYNSIFEIVENEYFDEQFKLIKSILADINLKQCFNFSFLDNYSKHIIYLMENKHTILIMIYLNIRLRTGLLN